MGNVRRVYVEKKPDFAVKAKELKHEVKHYLGIAADQVRVLIRYDVEMYRMPLTRRHCRRYFPSRQWMIFMRRTLTQKVETYFP